MKCLCCDEETKNKWNSYVICKLCVLKAQERRSRTPEGTTRAALVRMLKRGSLKKEIREHKYIKIN